MKISSCRIKFPSILSILLKDIISIYLSPYFPIKKKHLSSHFSLVSLVKNATRSCVDKTGSKNAGGKN